jgi:hypothetical protein
VRHRLAVAAALLTLSAVALSACSAAPAKKATPHPVATSVTAVSPTTGNTVPSGTVKISGSGLAKVTSVSFGTSKVAAKSIDGGSAVVVTPPPAANYQPTTVSLTLHGAGGKTLVTEKNAYSYTATSPVAKQLQYALQYWQNYNSAQFGNLNSVGGDCANFVSQTLLARGWQMNSDWYNNDAGGDWSPAWGYAPSLDEYFSDNASTLGAQELSFSQADRAKVSLGDVAFFDWDGNGVDDHVEVVTGIQHVNGQIQIKLASHNDDYDYRDLDQTITTQHPGATGHFWHLTQNTN